MLVADLHYADLSATSAETDSLCRRGIASRLSHSHSESQALGTADVSGASVDDATMTSGPDSPSQKHDGTAGRGLAFGISCSHAKMATYSPLIVIWQG